MLMQVGTKFTDTPALQFDKRQNICVPGQLRRFGCVIAQHDTGRFAVAQPAFNVCQSRGRRAPCRYLPFIVVAEPPRSAVSVLRSRCAAITRRSRVTQRETARPAALLKPSQPLFGCKPFLARQSSDLKLRQQPMQIINALAQCPATCRQRTSGNHAVTSGIVLVWMVSAGVVMSSPHCFEARIEALSLATNTEDRPD